MSEWSLDFRPEAEDDLAKIDKKLQKQIIEKLDWLQVNFDNIIPLALREGWKGFYKLRVGDCRVIYKINWSERLISVHIIDQRDKVYKRRK